MLQFARIGASVRIKELQAEIASIRKAFPSVGTDASTERRKPGRPKNAASLTPTAEAETQRAGTSRSPRKRRKMSAAARKAIGNAQRARWAKLKTAAAQK
jgi:hypothetical protein